MSAPILVSASFDADGKTITLTFDDGVYFAGSVFHVTVGGEAVPFETGYGEGQDAGGTQIVFRLADPPGDDVRIVGEAGCVNSLADDTPSAGFDVTVAWLGIDPVFGSAFVWPSHPSAVAASGTASPPSFTGSLSCETRRSLTTSADSDGRDRTGSLSAAISRRALDAMGGSSYGVTGSISVSRSPTVAVAAANFSPREFSVVGRGSEGWGLAGSFPVLGRAAAGVGADFTVAAPLVVARPPTVEFPVVARSSARRTRDFTVHGAGRSWAPEAASFPVAARCEGADIVFRGFPVVGIGGRPALHGDFTVLGAADASAFAAGEFDVRGRGAGILLAADFPVLAASPAVAVRGLVVFGRGPDGTPGARVASGVFDVRWETGMQLVFPIFAGSGASSSGFAVLSAGSAPASLEFPVLGHALGGVTSTDVPVVSPAAVAPSPTSGEFPVASPGPTGTARRAFYVSAHGWKP